MNIKNITITAIAAITSLQAVAQQKTAETTKNGLEYQFFKGKAKSEKSKQYGKEGDMISLNYALSVGDSVLFDSRNQNEGKPMKAILEPFTKETMYKTGIPMEAFYMLSNGDSAVFSTPAEDYFKSVGIPSPEWIKPEDKFTWAIKVASYTSYKDFIASNAKLRKATPDYQTLPSGLQYQFLSLGKGGYAPKPGDVAQFHVIYSIGDSVIFNSRILNDNKPVPQQLAIPMMKADLMEGLLAMQAGDSAQFRVKVADFAANTKTEVQEWMPKDGFHNWSISMVDVKSQEALKKEQEEKAKVLVAEEEKAFLDYFKANNITNYKKLDNGLYYVIHQEGTGEKVSKGKNVTVNYTGMLLNGKKFDSNVDPAFNHVEPFSFNAGGGNVIKGWDEGIVLLNKGAKATLFIPSPLAYGERGAGNDIPSNTPLVFEIEVVEFN